MANQQQLQMRLTLIRLIILHYPHGWRHFHPHIVAARRRAAARPPRSFLPTTTAGTGRLSGGNQHTTSVAATTAPGRQPACIAREAARVGSDSGADGGDGGPLPERQSDRATSPRLAAVRAPSAVRRRRRRRCSARRHGRRGDGGMADHRTGRQAASAAPALCRRPSSSTMD